MTQTKRILEHLQEGKTLTPLEALDMFGTFRLGSIIFNLRQDGFEIKTTIVDGGFGKRYAKYSMEVK